MRVPGEAVIAAHAEPAAGLEDPPGALGAAFERLLVAVDHRLRHAELRAALDARLLELQGRHHRACSRSSSRSSASSSMNVPCSSVS